MKKFLSFFMIFVLVISCIAAGGSKETKDSNEIIELKAPEAAPSVAVKGLEGKPWVNSNLAGNLPAEKPSLKDNFELNTNYELYSMAKAQGIEEDSYYDRSENYQQKAIRRILSDESLNSDELELLRGYIALFSDFNKRNNEGVQPLMFYIDQVRNCNSLEALSSLVQEGYLFGNTFAHFGIFKGLKDKGEYAVTVLPSLDFFSEDALMNLTGEETDEEVEEIFDAIAEYYYYLLLETGYEEDFAEEMIKSMSNFSADIKDYMDASSDQEEVKVMTLEEIKAFCTPLYDQIIGLGYYSEDLSVEYDVYYPGFFAGLQTVYNSNNLETIKAIMTVDMTSYAMPYLDMERYYAVNDLDENAEIDLFDIAYEFIYSKLENAVDQVFLQFEFPADTREKIAELTQMYIRAMRKRILSETWLSEETRNKAVEKLDNMVCVVVYPDNWIDFSELKELVKDHEQNLLDAVLCRDDFYRSYMTSYLGKQIDRGNWVMTQTRTTEANAYYQPSMNSINILAGILIGDLYSGNTIEGMLGTIGCTIGHEITHGFDPNGSKYNAFGDEENWWTDSDRAKFEARAQKIIDQLNGFEILDGVYTNGEQVIDEMVADIGGLTLSLDIAKDIKDFNYEAFFREATKIWYNVSPRDSLEITYATDGHPADYIRANYTIAQADEFYKTFNIRSGDGMYVAPENRVAVW